MSPRSSSTAVSGFPSRGVVRTSAPGSKIDVSGIAPSRPRIKYGGSSMLRLKHDGLPRLRASRISLMRSKHLLGPALGRHPVSPQPPGTHAALPPSAIGDLLRPDAGASGMLALISSIGFLVANSVTTRSSKDEATPDGMPEQGVAAPEDDQEPEWTASTVWQQAEGVLPTQPPTTKDARGIKAPPKKAPWQHGEEHVSQPQASLQALSASGRRELLLTSLQVVKESIERLPGSLEQASAGEWKAAVRELIEQGIERTAVAWLGEPMAETSTLLLPSWSTQSNDTEAEEPQPNNDTTDSLVEERALVHAFTLQHLRFRQRGTEGGDSEEEEEEEPLGGGSDSEFWSSAPAVLQDLAVLVADGVATGLLQEVRRHASPGADEQLTMQHLDWPEALHPRIKSTRSVERFCNQVLMWRWWDRNFASVRAMYEDRFILWGFDGSGRLVRRPLPARRGWELSRLQGLRYNVSLALEAMDVGWPVLQAVAMKLKAAVSWLLVTIIGHGLGLIFAGVRQSMGRTEGTGGGAHQGASPEEGQPPGGGGSKHRRQQQKQQQQDPWSGFGDGAFAA